MRRNALDFSWQRPEPSALLAADRDALTYNGVVLPPQDWFDECARLGIEVTLIFETVSERSLEGYQAGVYDAQFSNGQAKSRGYSTERTIVAVVSDRSSGNPSSGANRIADYGEAWARECAHPVLFYGNRYAVDAATEGARRVPGARLIAGPNRDGGWLPVTWGADPARDPLIQEANTPSPIDGTDENSAWHPYTGDVTPQPQRRRDDDMYVGWGTRKNGTMVTAKFEGGLLTQPFGGTVSPFGFYQDGYDWALRNNALFVNEPLFPDEIEQAITRAANALIAPGEIVPAPCDIAVFTDAELTAEVGRRLAA